MSKKIKALLAVVLCAAMLVAAASPAFAADNAYRVFYLYIEMKLQRMTGSSSPER